MKKNTVFVILALIISTVLSITLLFSCGNNSDKNDDHKTNIDEKLDSFDASIDQSDIDASYSENSATKIVFNGGDATVSGLGASANGADVTISGSGTFILSGKSDDASITVDSGKNAAIQLVLSDLELSNADGYAIFVESGKKITITLADGTQNVISDGNSYEIIKDNSTVDGAIFSKADTVLNGNGTLIVNGNNAHGIVSKDGLTVTGGNYVINSSSAGICGKDFIKITGASFEIDAGSDALRSDNDTSAELGYVYIKGGSFELNSVNDAIQAYSYTVIEDGNFIIKTSSTLSTDSAKGIKGGSGVKISGGTFNINSEDDAIHSDGDVSISNGEFTMSSGDDGIHANNTLGISGGNIIITKSYEGIEGTNINISGGYVEINSSDDGMNASGGNDSNTTVGGRPGGDVFGATNGSIVVSGGYIIIHNEGDGVDSNGSLEISGGVVLVDGPQSGGNGSLDYASNAKITGGVLIALGSGDMAQNMTEATQGSVLVSSSGYFSAGTLLSICDANGNVILAFKSTKAFRSALMSAPELKIGETYTFYQNADVSGLDKNGYVHNSTQSGGENCGSVTLEDYICGSGSGMGGGMPGGGRPGGRPW